MSDNSKQDSPVSEDNASKTSLIVQIYNLVFKLNVSFTKSRENKTFTDWNGFIKGLKRTHFNGALSFETAPVLTTFPDEIKTDVLGFVADIGRYFSGTLEKEA